jgi:MFS family permease
LRLFRLSIFDISAAQFLMATMLLFVAFLYVPSFLQTVQHKSAFTAGLYLLPLLVGLVTAAALAGPVIARTGHYKMYPVIGAILAGGSMYGLSLMDATSNIFTILVLMFFGGAGLGLFIQVSLLAGQNAAEYRDLGIATGALNFFKSIGGAFGAALFGAILTHGLGGGNIVHAYQSVFIWTLPFMGLALVLGLIMKEKPLSEEMMEVVEGKVEVPEY